MALDAYVMPLWRFKAGDFKSPIELSLGIKPLVIPLALLPPPLEPWYVRLLLKLRLIEQVQTPPEPSPEERHAVALGDVNALKAQLTQMIGLPIEWSDDGDVHYNKQFGKPVVMRALAAWHDHREELPIFPVPPEQDWYKHSVWSLPKAKQRRFPTLVDHGLYTGYLLPVEFLGVHNVEPYKIMDRWEFFHDVASSHVMLREATDFLSFVESVPEEAVADHHPILLRISVGTRRSFNACVS